MVNRKFFLLTPVGSSVNDLTTRLTRGCVGIDTEVGPVVINCVVVKGPGRVGRPVMDIRSRIDVKRPKERDRTKTD